MAQGTRYGAFTDKLTDSLHKVCGFDTDFKFITKSQMKTIQKKSKGRE